MNLYNLSLSICRHISESSSQKSVEIELMHHYSRLFEQACFCFFLAHIVKGVTG